MRSQERGSRENRRFSVVEKRPEDFFHGQLSAWIASMACSMPPSVATVSTAIARCLS